MAQNSKSTDLCKFCQKECDPYENPAVRCQGKCEQNVHVKCLKRGVLPSNLIGDVFYDLYCVSCSAPNDELLVRQKLSWLTTVILTLYNLREKSIGLSRRGYFHWKSDISIFISNNWDILFGKTVKRKKNWIGTISGTLSHYSGEYFKSGTAELGDQGWWKLIQNDPPEVLIDNYQKILELKKQEKLKLKAVDSPKSESNISYEDVNSDETLIEAKNKKCNTNENIKIEINNENNIQNYNGFEDVLDMNIDILNLDEDFPSFNLIDNIVKGELPMLEGNDLSDMFESDCFQYVTEGTIAEQNNDDTNISNVPSVVNSEEYNGSTYKEANSDGSDGETGDSQNHELPLPSPSLFNQSVSKPWPWEEPSVKIKPDRIRPLMSEREEEFLLQKIEQYKHLLNCAPVTVKRLYRKLKVRKEKRQLGLPVFNIDKYGEDLKNNSQIKKKGNIFLDRFISEDLSIYFEQRLQGPCELTRIWSPYIHRSLEPLIWRYPSCPAPWLKIMNELLAKVNHKNSNWKPEPMGTVDFSYVRPQHIPAMNSLCTQFFWPGIDLTECLQYPHTTCVALYKKLVIGFAVMVPDVSFNEAYISFLLVRPEWQKARIGTFMLYHLTQTVWGKDITLHVSTTNPALILYQKFGFQIENRLKDFYDKYIPPSSKESKDAFFLRLK